MTNNNDETVAYLREIKLNLNKQLGAMQEDIAVIRLLVKALYDELLVAQSNQLNQDDRLAKLEDK